MKENPHHPVGASAIGEDGLRAALLLPPREARDYVDLAFFAMTCFTAIRAETAHDLLSKDLLFCEPVKKGEFRSFVGSTVSTKTDPFGTGPAEDRTFVIPCTCASTCDNKSQKTKFLANLKIQPYKAECLSKLCPFSHVKAYRDLCPDPSGCVRESAKLLHPERNLNSLSFFRSLNPTGVQKHYTENAMGKLALCKN